MLKTLLKYDTAKLIAMVDEWAAPVGVCIVTRQEDNAVAIWGRFRRTSDIPFCYWAKDLKTAYALFYHYTMQ
jgi:hypothetical protein